MEEMCQDSPLRAKYNLYADTNLDQTDRSTLSLTVLLSGLFSALLGNDGHTENYI